MSDRPAPAYDGVPLGSPAREGAVVSARSLVSAIRNVVVIIGEDRRILEWSPAAECVYGWSREEALGKDYIETFLPEEIRPAVAADMRKVLAGEATRHFENPVRARDGTSRIIQWSVGCLHDGEGKPVAVVASGYDITEHKRSRDLLERREAELRAIIDNSPIALFVKDLEGRFTLTNRGFDDGFAFARGSAIGKTDADILPPETALQNRTNDQRALDANAPISFEEIIPLPGGVRTFLGSKFPLLDAQGKAYGVCGIASDITELRRAEEEREALQVRVIETQRQTLRELSTPLLPIARGVVLMPLVGAIDAGRAALVLGALLEGVVAHRAEIAILDITGVRTVDTNVAMGLVQAAQAAGLLGAEVVLTGVRPAAAQTLVEIGIDMRGIKTLSSLEQGVTYALARSGRRARPAASR